MDIVNLTERTKVRVAGIEEEPAGLPPPGENGRESGADHGALEYREWVADDLETGFGVTFPKAVGVKRGETVIFSWIVYKSRAHRDRVNAKVMKDPRLAGIDPKSVPFDVERMVHGGFKLLVGA